jgi:hypothetical protein
MTQYSLDELTDIFTRLGADDPEIWAKSQHEEGINQLHRFLFLRQAWKCVSGEQDDSWIDRQIAHFHRRPDEPYAGVGRALERLLALGADRRDLVDLVRGTQAEALFSFSYLLSDPDLLDDEVEEVREMGWALVEADPEGNPTGRGIGFLHESVLEMDPTHREMRPRQP